ncbi:MAG: cobalamin-binding protein [Planctomycetota bacterium]|jgi:iron complex transport system substrate-binding protein
MKKLWPLFIIIAPFLSYYVYRATYNPPNNVPTHPPANNPPTQIVSLAPNLTEILFALGLGEKIVAVSSDSDYPPQAANKNKVGTFWQPNTESIIASRPDLVITLSFEQQKRVADTLNRLRLNVLTLKIEKIEELLTAIKKIGTATGCKNSADKLIRDINNRLNNLQSKFNSTNKPKILWVVQTEPLRVAGRDTFINELIELAGGENAIDATIQQYPQIGTEQLLACLPEVIIQSAMAAANIAEQQKAAETFWSRWPSLPAVKNNKIYVINSDTVFRLGPRVVTGVELITSHLHSNTIKTKK